MSIKSEVSKLRKEIDKLKVSGVCKLVFIGSKREAAGMAMDNAENSRTIYIIGENELKD